MCFSATASFVAAGALSVTGVVTLRMVSCRAEIPFATIPLLFAIQQAVEGLIWLSLRNGPLPAGAPLTFLYSLFSHVFWPIFVPFAVGCLETVRWRKRALAVCQAVGLGAGLYLLYSIVRFPLTARVLDDHIAYDGTHLYILPVMALYLIATCVSSLLSGYRIIQVFGALSLISFVTAYVIHTATFVSVWCFFAAVLSSIVWLYFRQSRKTSAGAGAAFFR
ncbi:MAG TPA: DUF6629 family protein [Burkholderiales bacterium]|nr:DUF6629 family protein [Burkholderiales bacterium]